MRERVSPDAPRKGATLSYLPALDGIRGVGMLNIMGIHAGVWLTAGGGKDAGIGAAGVGGGLTGPADRPLCVRQTAPTSSRSPEQLGGGERDRTAVPARPRPSSRPSVQVSLEQCELLEHLDRQSVSERTEVLGDRCDLPAPCVHIHS
jgi:hypothetical protein